MKSLIRSFVVGTVVGTVVFFTTNLAEAGPTYAQRQAAQNRIDANRAALKMENRFKIERKDLNDKMLDAIRRSQHQSAPTLVPTPAPVPTPVRQDPYEPAPNEPMPNQPAPYQPTPYQPATNSPATHQPTTPATDAESDARYKMSLHQMLATYERLLEHCRANPGTTPEEQAANNELIQTVLRSRANVLHSLRTLESQGR